jgi:hypothetical protein
MIKYKLVLWVFNKGAWAQAVATAVDSVGEEVVAHMLDVSPKTVQNWMKMYQSAYNEFPHPNMSNFIKFCNAFDCDVREFWMLEDV